MRKNIVLLLAATTFFAAACNNAVSYTVKGEVDGLQGTIYLIDEDGAALDSTDVDNGAFTFTRKYKGPAYYSLSDAQEGSAPTFTAKFFVEPGVITVEAREVTKVGGPDNINKRLFGICSGTPANDAFNAMTEGSRAIFMEAKDPDLTEERQAELENEYDEFIEDCYNQNKTNYFGAYLLSQRSYDLSGEELLSEIELFPAEIQKSKILSGLKATAEQKVKSGIGKQYIEVTQNDPEGNPISLSSVVGNPANHYVLLDFWASWCGPCMAEVPYLVQTYKEFHSKGFEIYGVSFDTSSENWVAAIKDKGLNWIHVSDLNRFKNQAATDYAVTAIPSNVLIETENGTIIAKNLRGEDLYNTVSELMK